MKRHRLPIGLALALTIAMQNIAMAQNNDTDNKVTEKAESIVQNTEQSEASYLKEILQPSDKEYHWSAVVMDAKSKEILDTYGNTDKLYEPDGAFRAIPAAILLEKGKLSFSDTFSGGIYTNEDNVTILPHDEQKSEKTFFEHFINLNETLIVRAWNEKAGDLDIQKEVSAFFTPREPLTKTDYNLLGHGFHVTVKDMANAYLRLSGKCENGISEKTSKNMRQLLHEAYLEHISAEKESVQDVGETAGLYGSNYGKEEGSYCSVLSFSGFAPYYDPDIVVTILMEDRQSEIDKLSKDKNILEDVSAKIFSHYQPKRFFKEIINIDQIKAINSDSEYLIYFGRPTCDLCKNAGPVIRNAADSLNKTVFYFNTDRFRNIDDMQTVLDMYKIDAVPCILKVKNGEVSDRVSFNDENDMEEFVDKLFELLKKTP